MNKNFKTISLFTIFQVVFASTIFAQVSFPDCPDDEMVCIDDDTCLTSFYLNQPEATTNCTSGPQINYAYSSDFGVGDLPVDGILVENLPPGSHSILIIAEDECGNSAECDFELIVEDCRKPTPYCKNGIIAELMQTCSVEVWAAELDDNSFDNCSSQLKFSFSTDVNDIKKTFDLSTLGQNNVQIWVTDEAGNQDFCNNFIIVEDNVGCDNNPSISVSGHIQRDDGKPTEDVFVNCEWCIQNNVYTDQNGFYEFSQVELGTKLIPEKTGNPSDGVTVLDLIKIRKWILAIDTLSETRQIAGDINESGFISNFDIILISKQLLQIQDLDPNWAFDPSVLSINDTSQPITDADFIAIKKGDVIYESEVLTELKAPKLIISPEPVNNNMVEAHILVENFEGITGFQFGLSWDANVLSFEGISSTGNINFNQSGTNQVDEGNLVLYWMDVNAIIDGITLDDGTILYTLNFNVLNPSDEAVQIKFEDSLMPGQVVLPQCHLASPEWIDGKVQVSTNDLQALGIYLSLAPNPIAKNGTTYLEIETPNPQDLRIQLFDTNSNLVYEKRASFNSGRTTTPLSFPANSGIYLLKISNSEGKSQIQKLLVL